LNRIARLKVQALQACAYYLFLQGVSPLVIGVKALQAFL